MGTVATGQFPDLTGVSGARTIDRCQNGVLWSVLSQQGTNSQDHWIRLYVSTDNGTSWSLGVTVNSFQAAGFGGGNHQARLFIDEDDFAHVSYVAQQGYNWMYKRYAPSADRASYSLSGTLDLGTGSDTGYDFPDIVAFRDPATPGAWVAHTVIGFTNNNSVYYNRINITAGGALTKAGPSTFGATGWTGNSYPQIDFRHNGNGKTPALVGGNPQPDLFVLYTATTGTNNGPNYGLRFAKMTYTAGSGWAVGPIRQISASLYYTDNYWCSVFWDGTRVVIAGHLTGTLKNGTGGAALVIYERDAADTTTTERYYNDSATGTNTTAALQPYYGSATFDALGNVYFFGGRGTGSNDDVFYVKWDRASGTLGPRTVIDPTGKYNCYISCRRGPQGQAIDYQWVDGASAPYTVQSSRIILNRNPTAPTSSSPADNASWDSEVANNVVFVHNDPDGDAASAYRLSWRPAGTSVPYQQINGSTSAANGATVTVPIPAGTWVGAIEYYSQTFDTGGFISPPSPTRTVTALPASLTGATGGQGGTSLEALDFYTMAQSERTLRTLSLV